MIVLLWCWATLSHSNCEPVGFFDTLSECQQVLRREQRFDNRAIQVTGLKAMVRYHCQRP